jgi:hypothetical protein
MDPARWYEVERLYHVAPEREGAERASFLAAEWATGESLRREVGVGAAASTADANVGQLGVALRFAALTWTAVATAQEQEPAIMKEFGRPAFKAVPDELKNPADNEEIRKWNNSN